MTPTEYQASVDDTDDGEFWLRIDSELSDLFMALIDASSPRLSFRASARPSC